MNSATNLVIYDRMVVAINDCHRTDEVKAIRDKAIALEHYAKQALNVEAERKAISVRVRAERRAGQLLGEVKRAKGGDQKSNQRGQRGPTDFVRTKRKAKISDTQAKRWQRLADIPTDDFENLLKDATGKVSTTGLLDRPKIKPVPSKAIMLLGHLRDFEGFLETPLDKIAQGMTKTMQGHLPRLIPPIIKWLSKSEYS